MKNSLIFLVFTLALITCKDEMQSCEDQRAKLGSQIFYGFIHLCNAQQPDQIDLKGKVNIDLLDEDNITIRMMSDSTYIDTIFYFATRCGLIEDSPTTFIVNSLENDIGQYNEQPDRLDFSFGYPNCLENSFFEGVPHQ